MRPGQNPKFAYLLIGLLMLLVFGTNGLMLVMTPDDIWWTPESMALSVDDVSDRVTVLINGQNLNELLEDGKILSVASDRTVELSKADVGFRFNNWDRIKASWLGRASFDSAAVMMALLFIIYGLITSTSAKKDSASEAGT